MHVRILVYWLGISEVKGFCYSPSIGKTSLLTINMWSTITKAAYTKTKHTNWKGLLPRCKKNLDTGWHHHDIESVKSNGRHLQNTIRSLKTWSHRNSKIFLTVILLILPLYQLTPIRNSFLTHIIFFLTGAGFCFFFYCWFLLVTWSMSYKIDDGTPLCFIFLVFLQKDKVIRWETINRTAGKCRKTLAFDEK